MPTYTTSNTRPSKSNLSYSVFVYFWSNGDTNIYCHPCGVGQIGGYVSRYIRRSERNLLEEGLEGKKFFVGCKDCRRGMEVEPVHMRTYWASYYVDGSYDVWYGSYDGIHYNSKTGWTHYRTVLI